MDWRGEERVTVGICVWVCACTRNGRRILCVSRKVSCDFWQNVMQAISARRSEKQWLRIEWVAVKTHPQRGLLHSYHAELDFEPNLNTAHLSLHTFPSVGRWCFGVTGADGTRADRGSFFFITNGTSVCVAFTSAVIDSRLRICLLWEVKSTAV